VAPDLERSHVLISYVDPVRDQLPSLLVEFTWWRTLFVRRLFHISYQRFDGAFDTLARGRARERALAHAGLGAALWDAAGEQGRAMTLEQAMAEASDDPM
jgi:hypothetical protein